MKIVLYRINTSEIMLCIFLALLLTGTAFIPVISNILPQFPRIAFISIITALFCSYAIFKGSICLNAILFLFIPFLILWGLQRLFIQIPYPDADFIINASFFFFIFIYSISISYFFTQLTVKSVITIYSFILVAVALFYAVLLVYEMTGFRFLQLFLGDRIVADTSIYKGRSPGVIGQPSQSACLIVLAIPAAIYLCIEKRIPEPVLFVVLLFIFTGVLFTGSRSAIVEVLGLMALFITVFFRWKERRLLYITFFALVLFLTFVWQREALLNLIGTYIFGIPEAEFRVLSTQSPGRIWLYLSSIAVGAENLLIGVSEAGYSHALLEVALSDYWFNEGARPLTESRHAHNLFFHIFAVYGIFGLLVAIGFVCLLAIKGFEFLKAETLNTERMLCLASILIVLLYSMLEFPLWRIYFTWMFIFFCIPLFPTLRIPLKKSALRIFYCIIPLVPIGLYLPSIVVESCSLLSPNIYSNSYCQEKARFETIKAGWLQPYAITADYAYPNSISYLLSVDEAGKMKDWHPSVLNMYREFFAVLQTGAEERAWELWKQLVHVHRETGIFRKGLIAKQLEADGVTAIYPEFIEYASDQIY